MKTTDIKETAKLLAGQDNILILTHVSPDGDTIGSATALCLALRKLGKKARIECADEIPQKFRFLDYKDEVFDPEFIVAVDVASIELLGALKDKYTMINLCIDHHIKNNHYANSLCLYPKAAATCEIIFDIIKKLGKDLIDEKIATSLYMGISTDTGCFRYSNVTPDTHKKAYKLIKLGADHNKVNKIFFRTKSAAMLKLLGDTIAKADTYFDNRLIFAKITNEMMEKANASYDNCGEIVAIVSQLEGFDICVIAKEKDDSFKYSVRTEDGFDASEIAEKMGGGGHKNAAAFESKLPVEDIENKILKICETLI